MVFETFAYPFRYFLALFFVKLMKFQCLFTLGSPYDIAYLVFFKTSQVFAKHGFASVSRYLDLKFAILSNGVAIF